MVVCGGVWAGCRAGLLGCWLTCAVFRTPSGMHVEGRKVFIAHIVCVSELSGQIFCPEYFIHS